VCFRLGILSASFTDADESARVCRAALRVYPWEPNGFLFIFFGCKLIDAAELELPQAKSYGREKKKRRGNFFFWAKQPQCIVDHCCMQERGAKQQYMSPCVHARTKGKKEKKIKTEMKDSLHSQVA
jgi:hypothetical protein